MDNVGDTEDEAQNRARLLGAAIRTRRLEQGATLTEVARQTGLTHGFLSQLERGISNGSLRSLYLIAQVLGTTQQQLLAAAGPGLNEGDRIRRRNEGIAVLGSRILMSDYSGVTLTEFTKDPAPPSDYFVHPEAEFVYVVSGTLRIELGEPEFGEVVLDMGDAFLIPGSISHRHIAIGQSCTYLVLQTPA
jgi:transcriptional regulator with XRE-family HTH domain